MSFHAETYRTLAKDPSNHEALSDLAVKTRDKAAAMRSQRDCLQAAVVFLGILAEYFADEATKVDQDAEAIERALRERAS